MSGSSEFIAAREAVVERLKQYAIADERVLACWLQGSLADGSSDALSDVDAYLAIDDSEFDAVFESRRMIVAQLGRVLFVTDGLIPGLRAVNAVLDGPAKLDLIFERAERAPEAERPAVRMLVDKITLEPRLKTGWEPPLDSVAAIVRGTYSGVRQGGTWPLRLLLRGQWATFANAELRLINENLASMMAVQLYPRLLFKNPFTITRLLKPEQRAELEALTLEVIEGVARRDLAALRDAHLRVYDAFVREGKAAFAALGLDYPGTEDGDAGTRAMYQAQWPAEAATG